MSCKHNSSLTDEPILMKLYTVIVYDMKMCMKKENPDSNYFKWDNWSYTLYSTAGGVSFCDLTDSYSYVYFCYVSDQCQVLYLS